MATRGRRPCKHPRCPNLVTGDAVLCRAHLGDKAGEMRWVRRSGKRWREDAGYGNSGGKAQKVRMTILTRDHFTCQDCGHQANPHAMKFRELYADHIKPVARGGTSDPTNMQTLCGTCHDVKTKADIEEGKALARARK